MGASELRPVTTAESTRRHRLIGPARDERHRPPDQPRRQCAGVRRPVVGFCDTHGIMKEPTNRSFTRQGGSLSGSPKARGTLQGRSLARRLGSRARRAAFIGRDVPVEFGEETEVVSTKPTSSHALIDVEGMNPSHRDASAAGGSAPGGRGSRRLDPLGGHGCDLVGHSRQPYSGRQTYHPRGRSVRVLRRRRGVVHPRRRHFGWSSQPVSVERLLGDYRSDVSRP